MKIFGRKVLFFYLFVGEILTLQPRTRLSKLTICGLSKTVHGNESFAVKCTVYVNINMSESIVLPRPSISPWAHLPTRFLFPVVFVNRPSSYPAVYRCVFPQLSPRHVTGRWQMCTQDPGPAATILRLSVVHYLVMKVLSGGMGCFM